MPDVTDTFAEQLRAFVQEKLAKHNVPGCAVGVARRGQPVVAIGVGVDNVRAPRPVTAGTLFQIGSNTKTYTALAVAILAERGQLDLDAPVQRYCPSFSLPDPEAAAWVTVKMLLNHTSGWDGDVLLTAHAAGGRDDSSLAELPAQMATIAEQLTEPVRLQPGQRHSACAAPTPASTSAALPLCCTGQALTSLTRRCGTSAGDDAALQQHSLLPRRLRHRGCHGQGRLQGTSPRPHLILTSSSPNPHSLTVSLTRPSFGRRSSNRWGSMPPSFILRIASPTPRPPATATARRKTAGCCRGAHSQQGQSAAR